MFALLFGFLPYCPIDVEKPNGWKFHGSVYARRCPPVWKVSDVSNVVEASGPALLTGEFCPRSYKTSLRTAPGACYATGLLGRRIFPAVRFFGGYERERRCS